MKHRIEKVWVDDAAVHATTVDGLHASYQLEQWPRLAHATPQQRQNFYLSYSGIHWPDVDEDLSFEGMFAVAGLCNRTATEDEVYFDAGYSVDAPEPPLCVAEQD